MSQSSEWEELNRKAGLVAEAARILSVSEKDLPRVVERFLREMEKMGKTG